jgi:hypothetical protein
MIQYKTHIQVIPLRCYLESPSVIGLLNGFAIVLSGPSKNATPPPHILIAIGVSFVFLIAYFYMLGILRKLRMTMQINFYTTCDLSKASMQIPQIEYTSRKKRTSHI